MNNSPATQATAAGAGGGAFALVTIIAWILSNRGISMPADVIAALQFLISLAVHAAVLIFTGDTPAVLSLLGTPSGKVIATPADATPATVITPAKPIQMG